MRRSPVGRRSRPRRHPIRVALEFGELAGADRVDHRRVSRRELGDEGRKCGDERGLVHGRERSLHDVLSTDVRDPVPARAVAELEPIRICVEGRDHRLDIGLECRIRRGAGRVLSAPCVERLEDPVGDRNEGVVAGIGVRRIDRVQHRAADAVGMGTHHLERDGGSVRETEDVPLVDAHRLPEVGDIGGDGGSVVLGEIGNAVEAVDTGLDRRGRGQVLDLGGFGGLQPGIGVLQHLGAGERRNRRAGSTLVEHDEVPVRGNEAGVEQDHAPLDATATGPTGEVDVGVGTSIGGRGPEYGHRHDHLTAIGHGAILGHGEGAALEVGSIVGKRSESLVVARHRGEDRLVGDRRCRCSVRAVGGGRRAVAVTAAAHRQQRCREDRCQPPRAASKSRACWSHRSPLRMCPPLVAATPHSPIVDGRMPRGSRGRADATVPAASSRIGEPARPTARCREKSSGLLPRSHHRSLPCAYGQRRAESSANSGGHRLRRRRGAGSRQPRRGCGDRRGAGRRSRPDRPHRRRARAVQRARRR